MSTATDIATALRQQVQARISYLPDRKLHALLYLAQALWLAIEDTPLFPEKITATADGVLIQGIPTVTDLPDKPATPLTDPQFAVVLLTAGRYGGLSTMDLEALIRGQAPWASKDIGHTLDLALIRTTIRTQEEIPEGTVSGYPRSARRKMFRPAGDLRPMADTPDSPEEIAAFIADVQARM